ncbi:hypothetical protein ABPG75_005918 [Micractinium tetrahymenae]
MGRYLCAVALAVAMSAVADAAKPVGVGGGKPKPTCQAGLDNCLVCKSKKCATCADGFGLDNGKGICVQCNAGDGCIACAGNKPTKCTKCAVTTSKRGLFVDAKGACQSCKDANCATCLDKSGQCKACLPGYALQGSRCIACGAGMVEVRGRCKRCPANCQSCASPASCNEDGCNPDGFEFNPTTGECDAVAPPPEAR